jgi:hypothetical protein
MARLTKLLIAFAIGAALILPIRPVAADPTTVTYQVAGVEYARTTNFPVTSWSAGAAVSGTEYGVWNAVIKLDGGIVGDMFTFRSTNPAHNFDGTFGPGTFGPATGTCAKTTIPVVAQLSSGGTFAVTLIRYGKKSGSTCVVYLATVRGTATLAFG